MITINDKSRCSGCSACANKCPKFAIEMVEDDNGFKYPIINDRKCIDCGLCDRICPILNNKNVDNTPEAYACINNDAEVRKLSSSGGIFSVISKLILNKNGVVFGAAFDENFNLRHIYVDKYSDLNKLRTSKYLQSDIGDSYKEAKKFLDSDRLVLFTGTPCQIEGLKAYLNKEYENLYTQDVICHGVPSPKVWKKYREYRLKKDGEKPNEINFRNKDSGWHTYSLKFSYSKNIYVNTQNSDLFMRAFLSNLCLRDSCYNCSFKKYNRLSDITLADFWGIEHIEKDFDDNKGTSLVIINSKKGNEIFNEIKSECRVKRVKLDEAIKYNQSFIRSASNNKNRDKFFSELNNKEFDVLVRKYTTNNNIFKKVLRKIGKTIKIV